MFKDLSDGRLSPRLIHRQQIIVGIISGECRDRGIILCTIGVHCVARPTEGEIVLTVIENGLG